MDAGAANSRAMGRPAGFYGRFRIKLDAKGRLTLPALYRRALGADEQDETWLVLRQGNEGFIQVVPQPTWDALVSQSSGGGAGRAAERQWEKRLQFSSVELVSLDPKGRCTVPQSLLEGNGIGREVLVLGVGRLMEIWDPEAYFEQEAKRSADGGEIDDQLYG